MTDHSSVLGTQAETCLNYACVVDVSAMATLKHLVTSNFLILDCCPQREIKEEQQGEILKPVEPVEQQKEDKFKRPEKLGKAERKDPQYMKLVDPY